MRAVFETKIIYVALITLIALLVQIDNMIIRDGWCQNLVKSKNQIKEQKDNKTDDILASIFGIRTIAADFKWIETIQYIGDIINEKGNYGKFYPLLKQVVKFDRNFTSAYLTGSAILIWQLNRDKEGMEFIQDGIRNNPNYWQLNLYLAAFTYYKAQEYKKMIIFIEEAVKREGHPSVLERILGNFYVKTNEMQKARILWWWMYYNSNDAKNRKYAEENLKKYDFWN